MRGVAFVLVALLGMPHMARSQSSATITVAVAASFHAEAMRRAADFARTHGVRLRWVIGSSGRLVRQIERGAPFDVFVSADEALARRLGRPMQRIARGCVGLRLAERLVADPRVLLKAQDARIVIPDPRVAPIGAAARAALLRLGVWDRLRPRLVYARNALQAQRMVAHGWVAGGVVPVRCDAPHIAEVGYVLVRLRDAPAVQALCVQLAGKGSKR